MMTTSKPGARASTRLAHVAVPVVIAVAVACSSGPGDQDDGATSEAVEQQDAIVDADDFTALAEMTPVRGYFVANVLGHLDEAIQVAEDSDGGVYPVGTVIQLIPQEAMVKRAPGFDPASNDWEFFTLEVSAEGTTIVSRGGSEVVNRFTGGSCASCHSAAEPQFDFVCEDTHGCEPLPVDDEVITAIQQSDPRPTAGVQTAP